MKKLISALLALALCVSLSACGTNTDTDGSESTDSTKQSSTETTDTTETTESTTETTAETTAQTESEEEKQLKATKARYEKANEYLADYLEDGYFRDDDWNRYEDNTALEYLYKEFEACGDYEDSEETLSRFAVLPDMLTSITNTKTDNLGNVKEETYRSYIYTQTDLGYYNDNGIYKYVLLPPVLSLLGWEQVFYYKCEYDGDTIIAVKALNASGDVIKIATLEYDVNGNIAKANIQTTDDTFIQTYTYDEQNRLIGIINAEDSEEGGHCDYTYRYDENGNLVEKMKSSYFDWGYSGLFERKTTYSYDENNNLLKKKYVTQDKYDYGLIEQYEEDIEEYSYDENGYMIELITTTTFVPTDFTTIAQFLYTNDENGKPISAELIETIDGKNSYASQILTYNYETLYFYNAE